MEPEKAQLLATRQHSVKDVARWFGYPGHKLETDGQTQAYAAREQANLEYVVGSVRPIVTSLEQIIQKDLILDQETYFVEFLMDALFRGDLKSQAEYYAGRAMVLEAAREYDSGADTRLAPSCAKLFCSEMVSRVADRAVQVHGGSGYMRGVPVERFYRDSRVFRIYEGTSQIQQVIIARETLKRGG